MKFARSAYSAILPVCPLFGMLSDDGGIENIPAPFLRVLKIDVA